MRKPIIAGNWKMYKTVQETAELINGIKNGVAGVSNVEVVVCPAFTSLALAAELVKGSAIGLGAQNCYWVNEGAFTGETSPKMLKTAGCKYVIIGHSERRTYFGETNDTVNKKIKAALDNGLIPIVCVGERLEEREANKTFDVVKDHVVNGLKGITAEQMASVVIAYEPVWAIGTGKNATKEQAQEVHAYIRKLLTELFGSNVSENVRIQYGGSVKPENIAELIAEKDVDGALVGGASLKAESFVEIVKKSSR